MASNSAPQIDARCALIAPAQQLGLAAVISSYFREAEAYVPVFEFPEVDIPYSPSAEIGKDGYFGHIVGDRAAVAINNALAAIRPQLIVLLGLTATQQTHLRVRLPQGKLIEIDSLDDVAARLRMAQPEGDAVACRPSQILEGFLAAKFGSRPLRIDETAAELPSAHRNHGKGIVLIEDGGGLPELAAINYAFAVNADVVLIPPVDRKELGALPQKLHAWSNDRSHPTLAAFKRKLMRPIWGVPFKDYAFATFFTVGVPYGLFIENVIPCTHVLNNWHCGVFLATVIADEHNPVVFDSTLVFSPQQFGSDETDEIAHLLSAGQTPYKACSAAKRRSRTLKTTAAFFPTTCCTFARMGAKRRATTLFRNSPTGTAMHTSLSTSKLSVSRLRWAIK